MLRHRIEGLIGLHSAVLFAVICALFIVIAKVLPAMGWVVLHKDVNLGIYFCGVLVAMALVHRNLQGAHVRTRYGRLTLRETFRLTAHQMMRLMLVMFTLAFLMKDSEISRLFLLTFLAAAGAALLILNTFLPKLLSALFFRHTTYNTVILSSADQALRIGAWIEKYRTLGVNVMGYYAEAPAKGVSQLPWMGRPEDLMRAISEKPIHQVLIDQTIYSTVEAREISVGCEQLGCRTRCFIDISSLMPPSSLTLEQDDLYAFASFTPEPLDNPMNRAAKRMLDIAVSLPVVLFVLPCLLFVTAIVQRFQSPGPVIYRQVRSGMNRRKFLIYKLRTMHIDDGKSVAIQAKKGDSRIYPFGKFLRRSSLDELPQFLNVLRGEMSVSGPRPHLTQHDDDFARVIQTYRKRHFVKPGITGLAQSKGLRGEIVQQSMIRKRVRYDTHYVAKWSLGMDIRIIINTIRQIISPPPSAY